MARAVLNRCMWLMETIRRYGRITRSEVTDLWVRSPLSDGKPMSRRTFANYIEAAEDLFNVKINCDTSTYEYYISEDCMRDDSVVKWTLDSLSLNNLLSSSQDIAGRIFVENIPSAREHLGIFLDALRSNTAVRFDYHSYARALPRRVTLEPYFVKLFKQRWYVVGRVTDEKRIKTYALDRMHNVKSTTNTFVLDQTIDPDEYFKHSYGIVVTRNKPVKVVLRADHIQAKYFADLPLHPSQSQTIADTYSLFTMTLRITDDFVAELLSHGNHITVLEPPELVARMKTELQSALDNYSK